MATRGKRFAEHSARWQRDARRDGITPARWNRWFTLTQATRRKVKQREYATGRTARDLIRESLEAQALRNFRRQVPIMRESTVRRGLRLQSVRQLMWTIKAGARQLIARARRKPMPETINPWWYR